MATLADQQYLLPVDFARRYGPWAVIPGGSEGTGESFARMLASVGINLVLLARREGPLNSLADSLRKDYSIEVRTRSVDLTAPDIVAQVRAVTDDIEVGLLIYNAGSNIAYDHFTDWSTEQLDFMLNMNCYAPVHLSHHFAKGMCERGRGGIMLLSSMAAFSGTGLMAIYPATKAFDHIFAEGLWQDLKPRGVDAMCLYLGATLTASHANVNFSALNPNVENGGAMKCDDVAYEGLSKLGETPLWVAGEHNRALLPPGFIDSRPLIIDAATEATAKINDLPHVSMVNTKD